MYHSIRTARIEPVNWNVARNEFCRLGRIDEKHVPILRKKQVLQINIRFPILKKKWLEKSGCEILNCHLRTILEYVAHIRNGHDVFAIFFNEARLYWIHQSIEFIMEFRMDRQRSPVLEFDQFYQRMAFIPRNLFQFGIPAFQSLHVSFDFSKHGIRTTFKLAKSGLNIGIEKIGFRGDFLNSFPFTNAFVQEIRERVELPRIVIVNESEFPQVKLGNVMIICHKRYFTIIPPTSSNPSKIFFSKSFICAKSTSGFS